MFTAAKMKIAEEGEGTNQCASLICNGPLCKFCGPLRREELDRREVVLGWCMAGRAEGQDEEAESVEGTQKSLTLG